ncbi:hypothetical protein [Methanobrevibacter boviskoreani]|uniref:hypothetical protein n=1 Tax=Methanobrevibacter boviskoreani TaxID=1348249 RepID=UPI0023A8F065|nr:hypothetical protein [Methanobrevibacter boviskoreani]MCI6775246.1 hypothetical protein [Methanobrevibacter boviskoreani]MDD6257533.1 hypothetical protein [Methanobrevibacter boviskoreani]MDY5614650.1 hypothetical protein [Methanobrevibacter boviskoreani]
MSNDKDKLDEAFQLASSLFENHQFISSLDIFKQLLLEDYELDLILPYMIRISLINHDLSSTLDYINLYLSDNPEDIEILFMKASILLKNYKFEEALDVANHILELDEDNDSAISIKVSALKMLGRFDEIEELDDFDLGILEDGALYDGDEEELLYDAYRDNPLNNSYSNDSFQIKQNIQNNKFSNETKNRNTPKVEDSFTKKSLGFITADNIETGDGDNKKEYNQGNGLAGGNSIKSNEDYKTTEEELKKEGIKEENLLFTTANNLSKSKNENHIKSNKEDNSIDTDISFIKTNHNKNIDNENLIKAQNDKEDNSKSDALLNNFINSIDKQMYSDYEMEDFKDDDGDEYHLFDDNDPSINKDNVFNEISDDEIDEILNENDDSYVNDEVNHDLVSENDEDNLFNDKELNILDVDDLDVPLLGDDFTGLDNGNCSDKDDIDLDEIFDFDDDGNLMDEDNENKSLDFYDMENDNSNDGDSLDYGDNIEDSGSDSNYGDYESNGVDEDYIEYDDINDDDSDLGVDDSVGYGGNVEDGDSGYNNENQENRDYKDDKSYYDEDIDDKEPNHDENKTMVYKETYNKNRLKGRKFRIHRNMPSTLDYFFNFSSSGK